MKIINKKITEFTVPANILADLKALLSASQISDVQYFGVLCVIDYATRKEIRFHKGIDKVHRKGFPLYSVDLQRYLDDYKWVLERYCICVDEYYNYGYTRAKQVKQYQWLPEFKSAHVKVRVKAPKHKQTQRKIERIETEQAEREASDRSHPLVKRFSKGAKKIQDMVRNAIENYQSEFEDHITDRTAKKLAGNADNLTDAEIKTKYFEIWNSTRDAVYGGWVKVQKTPIENGGGTSRIYFSATSIAGDTVQWAAKKSGKDVYQLDIHASHPYFLAEKSGDENLLRDCRAGEFYDILAKDTGFTRSEIKEYVNTIFNSAKSIDENGRNKALHPRVKRVMYDSFAVHYGVAFEFLKKNYLDRGINWGETAMQLETQYIDKLTSLVDQNHVDQMLIKHDGIDTTGSRAMKAMIQEIKSLDPDKNPLITFKLNGEKISGDELIEKINEKIENDKDLSEKIRNGIAQLSNFFLILDFGYFDFCFSFYSFIELGSFTNKKKINTPRDYWGIGPPVPIPIPIF